MSVVVIMTSLVASIVAGIPIAVALGMLAIVVMWWAAGSGPSDHLHPAILFWDDLVFPPGHSLLHPCR